MGKQYTFKTTRATQWVEDILDCMDKGERSEYIRECFMIGHSMKGNFDTISEPVAPSIMPKLKKAPTILPKKESNVESSTEQENIKTVPTNFVGTVAPPDTEPEFEMVEKEINMDDLEAKLNNIYKD